VTRLAAVGPDQPLFRIGRKPDPWAWPDWAYAIHSGTFGNRYDDPDSDYRVLYAASDEVAPFVETLARFRPDVQLLADLEEINDEPDDPPTMPGGVVPEEWFAKRSLGQAAFDGRFCDIADAGSLTHLRLSMAATLVQHGLDDLDAGDIRSRGPRELTQRISREVFEASDDDGGPFDGIRYPSRLGDGLVNWAIFEGTDPHDTTSEDLRRDHPALRRALELLDLRLEDD
jgi:hypothetical protein